jgi:hypothetical protein
MMSCILGSLVRSRNLSQSTVHSSSKAVIPTTSRKTFIVLGCAVVTLSKSCECPCPTLVDYTRPTLASRARLTFLGRARPRQCIRLHFYPQRLGRISPSGSSDRSLGQAAIDSRMDYIPAWTSRNTSSICAKACHEWELSKYIIVHNRPTAYCNAQKQSYGPVRHSSHKFWLESIIVE